MKAETKQNGLTKQQLTAYWRWRRRYGTAEAAAEALCPIYLFGAENLHDKLYACYRQRLREGAEASAAWETLVKPQG